MRGTAAGVLLLCVDRVHDGGLRCVCARPLLKTRTAFYLSGVTGDIYAYNKAERVGSPSGPAWDAGVETVLYTTVRFPLVLRVCSGLGSCQCTDGPNGWARLVLKDRTFSVVEPMFLLRVMHLKSIRLCRRISRDFDADLFAATEI
jgi:hypothetical protein